MRRKTDQAVTKPKETSSKGGPERMEGPPSFSQKPKPKPKGAGFKEKRSFQILCKKKNLRDHHKM